MNPLPRHVVIDLLPLYIERELSADTAALVDAYLATDAPLRVHVAEGRANATPSFTASVPAGDAELRSVRRTRKMLAVQRWLFGLAIGFTAVGLSPHAQVGSDGVTDMRLMVMDYPLPFGACIAAGLACWGAYRHVRAIARV